MPGLPFLQPHQAQAGRPLLFTWSWVSLGTNGLAQPRPHPLLATAHTGGRGGGWAASWTPAPLPCLPGPGSLGPLLGWEQEAVAALGEVGIQGCPPGWELGGELNVAPLRREKPPSTRKALVCQGDLGLTPGMVASLENGGSQGSRLQDFEGAAEIGEDFLGLKCG